MIMALVVVAEDNIEHQRAIGYVVRRGGHDVVLTNDGVAGLAAVTEHRPDLVIADVDMPGLDGLKMCRAIRTDPALADLPVVLISAYLMPNDPSVAAAGATGIIRKPFSIDELSARVTEHLAGDGAGPAVRAPVAAEAGEPDAGADERAGAVWRAWQLLAESTPLVD